MVVAPPSTEMMRHDALRGDKKGAPPLRIGIDYRSAVRPHPTGVGRYVRDLMTALTQTPVNQVYTLLHNEPGTDSPPAHRLRIQRFKPVWRRRGVRIVWEEVLVPATLRRLALNVYHGPHGLLPLALPGHIGAVITVHDLVHRKLRQTLGFPHRLHLDLGMRWSLRRADAIIVDSQNTAADLHSQYGVEGDRVRAIYPGIMPEFRPIPPPAARRAVAERFGLSRPYLLYTGGLGRRKNVLTLLQAFAALRARQEVDLEMALAGDLGGADEVLAYAESHGLHQAVHFLGYVADEHLPALYSAATVFAYPSLYEGFGYPVLEAMACGAPVVCSETASLPEVAGDAAILVDPYAVRPLVEALRAIVAHPELQATMRARGIAQAARFSLAAEATAVSAVYDQVHARAQAMADARVRK